MTVTFFFFFFLQIVLVQREYFKQGKIEQFRQILLEGSSHGMFSSVQHLLTISLPMMSTFFFGVGWVGAVNGEYWLVAWLQMLILFHFHDAMILF